MLMLEREGVEEFAGFTYDFINPEYVVVGDNRSNFDFDHLNQSVRLLRKGAKLIGMTSELLDTSMGELELNVGAWVKLLELASSVQATYIGKPIPFALEYAFQSMGLNKYQVAAVGDRVGADIKGANEFGLQSILVRTGEYDPIELAGPFQSDYQIDSIADLSALVY